MWAVPEFPLQVEREQGVGRDGWWLPRPLHMGVPWWGGVPQAGTAGCGLVVVLGPDGADSHETSSFLVEYMPAC